VPLLLTDGAASPCRVAAAAAADADAQRAHGPLAVTCPHIELSLLARLERRARGSFGAPPCAS